MKIFYTHNDVTDDCMQPCPCDIDNAYVGSVYCTQECPHCFGRSKDFNEWALFPNENHDKKPFTYREMKYVYCAGVYEKLAFKTKIYLIFYKYISKHVLNLRDKLHRYSLSSIYYKRTN